MKKRKNGFTLIELLAVIVILAVIALISTPIIMNIIEDSRKGAFKSSVQSIFSAYETYELKNNFEVEDKVDILDLPLTHKENFISGKVYKDGSTIKIENVSNGVYCASGTLEELQITDGECKSSLPMPTLAEKINSLLENDETVIAKDSDQNPRYVGKDPDNYIYFNNEMWRIIGVFDENVKIIRNESIGKKSWNGTNKNDWINSKMYSYLNTTYYDSLDSVYKEMVENAIWRIGGGESASYTSSKMYDFEKRNPGYNSSSALANGYIGLMSVSDYGYASSECYKSKSFSDYNDTLCTSTNWLYMSNSIWDTVWFITPSTSSTSVWVMYGGGHAGPTPPTNTNIVIPSLYLKSNVKVNGGTGTSSDPYTISMDQ